MKYHYNDNGIRNHRVRDGSIRTFDHPVYTNATFFNASDDRGMCVIQQKFNRSSKSTYWTNVDPWLANAIFEDEHFKECLNEIAREPNPNTGLYPTVTVRQLMWALRMKPLKKEVWETMFDRSLI